MRQERIEVRKYKRVKNRNHRQVRKTIIRIEARSKQAFPIPTRPSSV